MHLGNPGRHARDARADIRASHRVVAKLQGVDALRRQWHEERMPASCDVPLWFASANVRLALLRQAAPLACELAGSRHRLVVNWGIALELCAGTATVGLGRGELVLLASPASERESPCKLRSVPADTGAVELLVASFEAGSGRFSTAPRTFHLRASEIAQHGALKETLTLLHSELGREATEGRVACGLSEALVGYVLRVRDGAAETAGAARPCPVTDLQVRRALELMTSEPARRFSLSALAKVAGLSRAQFARRFAAALGVSPLRYLTEVRLRNAAELLERSDAALADIALRVGYESEFAFSRAFKRFAGEAPGQFRRRVRSDQTRMLSRAA